MMDSSLVASTTAASSGTSSLASPSTASSARPTSAAVSARSCPRCSRRMSSLQYVKHSLCTTCRTQNCTFDHRCFECASWSEDFM